MVVVVDAVVVEVVVVDVEVLLVGVVGVVVVGVVGVDESSVHKIVNYFLKFYFDILYRFLGNSAKKKSR